MDTWIPFGADGVGFRRVGILVEAAELAPVEIGSRRELFVDELGQPADPPAFVMQEADLYSLKFAGREGANETESK